VVAVIFFVESTQVLWKWKVKHESIEYIAWITFLNYIAYMFATVASINHYVQRKHHYSNASSHHSYTSITEEAQVKAGEPGGNNYNNNRKEPMERVDV
jgi:hypothetical protein